MVGGAEAGGHRASSEPMKLPCQAVTTQSIFFVGFLVLFTITPFFATVQISLEEYSPPGIRGVNYGGEEALRRRPTPTTPPNSIIEPFPRNACATTG